MAVFLQNQFWKFHEAIQLPNLEDQAVLSKKRRLLIDELQYSFPHSFSALNQGSYTMNTGIKPIKRGDYDIDVALICKLNIHQYDPAEVKDGVRRALAEQYDRTVIMKRPCVRVQYPDYRVDLAVYGKDWAEDLYLAKGFKGSNPKNKIWERAEPKRLKELLQNRFSNAEEQAQFRRIIRYLKRWKDVQFPATAKAAPTGIIMTALAYEWFRPHFTEEDGLQKPNDLEALCALLVEAAMHNYGSAAYSPLKLPVKPYHDLFEQMREGRYYIQWYTDKMDRLKSVLQKVQRMTPYPRQALEVLQAEFGTDFPVF